MTAPGVAARSRAASLALAGFGIYGVLLVAVHFASPGYQAGVHFLSDYANGPGARILQLAFVAAAGAEVMLVRALGSTPIAPRGSAVSRLLLLDAALKIVLLVFPIDPMGAAFAGAGPPDLTTAGWIHMLTGVAASGVFFLAGILATRAVWRSGRARGWLLLLVLVGLLWCCFYGLTLASQPVAWPAGWYQRLSIGAQWVWLLSLAALARSSVWGSPDRASSTVLAPPDP